MEAMKKNWPLFACTAVIVVTLIGCSLFLSSKLEDIRWSLDYYLAKIATHTER